MIGPFLISIREGLEMALIVAIILAYLAKTGNRNQFRYVWFGLFSAALTSVAVGGVIFLVAGALEGAPEKIFEGIAMFVAVGILTYMIFWMRKISRNIKSELESRVDASLDAGSGIAMFFLVYVAVVREGLEEALFLFSASQTSTALQSIAGAILGLSVAAILGYTIYTGSRWLNLRTFFNATSIILILVAAGLLAHGIHEFLEINAIPPVISEVWNTNGIIDEKGIVGGFLKAILGYNGNPALIEVAAYFGYLIISLLAYVRPMLSSKQRGRQISRRPSPTESGA